MSSDMTSAEKQEAVGKLVSREVIYCVSSLVSELVQRDEYNDELFPVCIAEPTADDFREAIAQEDLGDVREAIEYAVNDEVHTLDQVDDDDLREVADRLGVEPEQREVFEHWIVSRWLGNRLEAAGEPVLFDFMGIEAIWGRTTTGQAILLDSVIEDIYDATMS